MPSSSGSANYKKMLRDTESAALIYQDIITMPRLTLSAIGIIYTESKQIRSLMDYYFDEFSCRHTFLTFDKLRANVMLRAACVVKNN